MKRKDRDVLPEERAGSHGDRIYSHPAFAHIQANRVQGSRTLFGSEFDHHHYITLKIRRCELVRGLNHDHYYPEDHLIEVAMSETQWATFLSSVNSSGSPCTLTALNRTLVPDIPPRDMKSVFSAEFTERLDDLGKEVDRISGVVEKDLTSLSAKRRESVLSALRGLKQRITNALPFVAESFSEHMETTVEQAKAEVNAHVQREARHVGLSDIKPPIALPSGKEEA